MEIIDSRTNTVYYRSQPGRQTLFHNLIDTRAETGLTDFLYGGAAKGGKSWALRMQAHAEALTNPGIRILMLRGQLTDLEQTHILDLPKDLPPDWYTFNISKHRVRYFNDSLLVFGFLEKPENLKRYLSTSWDIIMPDEMTTVSFLTFLAIKSRLAASVEGFLPYMAGATNPGDIGHRHVKSYFLDKDFGDEFPELGDYFPEQVAFLPATIHDNPIQIKRDPGILKRLQALPDNDRKRFYEGNWDIFEGQFFGMLNRLVHTYDMVETETGLLVPYSSVSGIPRDTAELAAMDYGNFSIAYIGNINNKGDIKTTHEWVENDPLKTLEDRAQSYYNFLEFHKKLDIVTVGDTDLFADPAPAYGENRLPAVDAFKKKGLKFIKISKKADNKPGFRVYCNEVLKDLFNWRKDDHGIFVRKPKVMVLKDACPWFWKTVPALVHSKINPKDIDQTQGIDHPYDAFKMLMISLRRLTAQKDSTGTRDAINEAWADNPT